MSEFQIVAFRAIDGPVSGKNLEFMQRQSTRAEITPWSFDNEYHHSDFRGNTAEMLRRGYDFHLHYANFGVRTLMIRLPHGLPDAAAAKPYFEKDSLYLQKDKRGTGQILHIQPFFESGYLDDIWETGALVDRLLPLRAEMLDGDLRPLYLTHLAVAGDVNHDPDEEKEAPVPAGLAQLTDAQQALAEFFGLSDSLIAAAAQASAPPPDRSDPSSAYATWLQQQPDAAKTDWLARLMADAGSAVRSEMLGKFLGEQDLPAWPTSRSGRMIAELLADEEVIELELDRQEAEAEARQRAKSLAEMAADPRRILGETEQLVKAHKTASYARIAELLADLREALAGSEQSDLAENQALKLKQKHPTLRALASALRRKGFCKAKRSPRG